MRTYETIFIVHPDVAGDDLTATVEKFTKVLTDQGAEILKVDNWGTKTLAYTVKKQAKGTYILVIFDAPSTAIAEFERRMRIDEKVIKFQTVVLEGGYQAPAAVASDETAAADVDEDSDVAAEEDEETEEED